MYHGIKNISFVFLTYMYSDLLPGYREHHFKTTSAEQKNLPVEELPIYPILYKAA
jgi:hypothetical protein